MASASTFRFASKSLFLTFPQCDFPLDDFVNNLNKTFPTLIEKGVACQERHQDGNSHLHCALIFTKTFQTRQIRFFDGLVSPPKHPNINSKFKGGAPAAFKYCMKEGNYRPLPSANEFDLETFMDLSASKKSTKAALIVSEIQTGATLNQIDDLFPDYLLLHLSSVERYSNFVELKKKQEAYAMTRGIPILVKSAIGHITSWNTQIATWLQTNLRMNRVHRQKQMWIKGPPECGKTHLIMWLETTFNLSIYYWPKGEDWWDGYRDNSYDLIVLDEYRAQKKITDLNPILSGDPVPLSRRNAPAYVKRHMLPVLILSNFTPAECYSLVSHSQLAPLLSRLEVVEIPDHGLLRIEKMQTNFADEALSDDDILSPSLDFDTPPTPVPLVLSPAIINLSLESSDDDSFICECLFLHEGPCPGPPPPDGYSTAELEFAENNNPKLLKKYSEHLSTPKALGPKAKPPSRPKKATRRLLKASKGCRKLFETEAIED